MEQRFEGRRKPVLRTRARRERITIFRAAETDGAKLRRHLDDFQHHIATLGHDVAATIAAQQRE